MTAVRRSCERCGADNSEFNAQCVECGAALELRPAPRAILREGPAPERAGAWRLLRRLGRGGMGQVWLAEDEAGRHAALKTVEASSAGMVPALRREIAALRRLRHPGIVRVLDSGLEAGVPWYAMELVEGRPLRSWEGGAARTASTPEGSDWWTASLQSGGERRAASGEQQPEQHTAAGAGFARSQLAARGSRLSSVLTLVRRLCVPLGYLHGEGLVHGDLKPDNILIRAASSSKRGRSSLAARGSRLAAPGWPVLVDFGLAATGSVGREALSVERGAAGTLHYMAPEQIAGQPFDARADLYALGCVLYELLTGRPPFVAEGAAGVRQQHLSAEPRPPSSLQPGLPGALDELVLRLLRKAPAERLGHAADVARVLGELGAGTGGWPGAPRARAYLYRPALAGREGPLAELDAALDRLQEGCGGLALVAGESGVGKTRLLVEVARRAGRRQVRVLAGECVPGVVSSEPPRSSVGARLASPSASAGQAMPLQVDAGSAGSGSAAGSESVRVARGRSRRSPSLAGASGPLEALRKPLQAVADRCRERGSADTDRLLGRRGKVLSLYEPALAGLPGQEAYPEPAELPPEAARLRVYSYLAETLAAFGEGVETVLLLDDLQWADELTLGFLEYWLRRQAAQGGPAGARSAPAQDAGAPPGGSSPLLIVGAYRSEEAGVAGIGPTEVGAQHAAPLQRLIGSPEVTSIDLGRLDEAAVGSMIGDMLALRPPPRLFARHMARHSEGNPFFVAEYLRTAVDEGLLGRDGQGVWQVAEPGGAKHAGSDAPSSTPATEADYEALPLPRSLRELVGRRLAGLDAPARKLAQAAAVLGREFDTDVLRAVVGEHQDALWFDAISELLRRQVLEASSPGTLRFVHDKLREVAYENLRKATRKKLHRAAAGAIETVHAVSQDEQQAALGRHWEEAADPARARLCYLAAARRATKRYDHAEAERLYRAYLRLVEEPTAESATARIELGGKVLFTLGRYEDGLSEHRRALMEARLVGDRRNEAKALQHQAHGIRVAGRADEARQLYGQALVIYREMGDRASEADVLGSLGNVDFEQGRLEEARQLHGQALVIHREGHDRAGEGIVLGNLAVLHGVQGRLEEARLLFEQALAIHRVVSGRCGEGVILGNLGLLCTEQGRPEEALHFFVQALAISRETGFRDGESTVLTNLGMLHAEQGRLEEARQLFVQALAIFRELGARPTEGVVLGNLGNLVSDQGRLEEARQLFDQALAISREVGDRHNEASALGKLGNLHMEKGEPEAAQRHYEQALDLHRELSDRRSEGFVLGSLARLARLTSGELAPAAHLAEQAEECLTEAGARPLLGELLCNRGHLELAAGRSGRSLLERAQALAEASGSEPESGMGKAASHLRRACEAFEAGEQHRLFRGELLEDIPEGLRRWLRETGQLRAH